MQPDPIEIDLYAATGSSPPPEPLITAQVVAERIGVTKQTVLAWQRHGVVPSYRPPGKVRPVRFRWSEIERALGTNGEVAS